MIEYNIILRYKFRHTISEDQEGVISRRGISYHQNLELKTNSRTNGSYFRYKRS